MSELQLSTDASDRLHMAIATKIEADPSLLEIPLANIDRWLAQDHSAAHRLEHWRALILEARASAGGMRALLWILRDPGEDARHFRAFAPFAGVLTTRERREVRARCAYAH